ANSVYAVAFSPDSRLLATAGGWGGPFPSSHDPDNAIYLWKPHEGKKVRRLPGKPHDWAFYTVAFSPDGKTIVSWQVNQGEWLILLWEATTGAERLTIKAASDRAVVFSPDGRTLAAASGGTIRLWDALTGKERRQISGHDGAIYKIAFSPDGKTLASASQ